MVVSVPPFDPATLSHCRYRPPLLCPPSPPVVTRVGSETPTGSGLLDGLPPSLGAPPEFTDGQTSLTPPPTSPPASTLVFLCRSWGGLRPLCRSCPLRGGSLCGIRSNNPCPDLTRGPGWDDSVRSVDGWGTGPVQVENESKGRTVPKGSPTSLFVRTGFLAVRTSKWKWGTVVVSGAGPLQNLGVAES